MKIKSLFIGIFVVGVLLCMIGRILCVRSTENYWDLQPELTAPEEIDKVLHDPDLKQLYVCYNDASYVDVYTESGEFLWAVSTPYLRNTYFELRDDRLIIYNDEAYIYNSADGSFIECVDTDDLNLEYDWENEGADEFEEGEFYFGTYQVYRARSDGSLETVVARPWWHWCFNFGVCGGIAFSGAVGVGITIFLEKKKDYGRVRRHVKMENRRAKVILYYFRITSAVQVVYAILDIIFGFFGGILCIGILPLGIHFIISNIIIWNMIDHISVSQDEATVLDYWKTVELATFIVAFFSVIVAVGIAA